MMRTTAKAARTVEDGQDHGNEDQEGPEPVQRRGQGRAAQGRRRPSGVEETEQVDTGPPVDVLICFQHPMHAHEIVLYPRGDVRCLRTAHP